MFNMHSLAKLSDETEPKYNLILNVFVQSFI